MAGRLSDLKNPGRDQKARLGLTPSGSRWDVVRDDSDDEEAPVSVLSFGGGEGDSDGSSDGAAGDASLLRGRLDVSDLDLAVDESDTILVDGSPPPVSREGRSRSPSVGTTSSASASSAVAMATAAVRARHAPRISVAGVDLDDDGAELLAREGLGSMEEKKVRVSFAPPILFSLEPDFADPRLCLCVFLPRFPPS
jgi:hypothetical protein